MKKILVTILFLLSMLRFGYCDNKSVQIESTTSKSEVFAGEWITVNLRITNHGDADISVEDSRYTGGFKKQWVTDNSQVQLTSGSSINIPMLSLKPGQDYNDQVSVHISDILDLSKPVVFRMGFKATPDSQPVWSNPITITSKKDEAFPIKIEVSLSKGKSKVFPDADVSIRVTNIGNVPQYIGEECFHAC